jgi:hypothetical protein
MPPRVGIHFGIVVLVCVGAGAAHLEAAARLDDPGIRLVSSDARGADVEITVGALELVPVAGADGFVVPRAVGFDTGGGEGEPALLVRALWFGVPEGVTVRVDATALETKSFDGIRLAPRIREDVVQGDGAADAIPALERLSALASSSAYTAARLDAPLATLGGITGLRAQRVARIELRPARYDAAGRRLEVATRIALHVSFVGRAARTPTPAIEPAFEPIYCDLLVNAEAARAFRRPVGWTAAASWRAAQGARTAAGFDDATTWLRVRVAKKGLQQIRGSDLAAAGIALEGVDPARLRLYTRPGMPMLAEDSVCDTCGLKELAIRLEGTDDGTLDADDRIVFFGLGASGWRDDYTGPSGAPDEWLDHPYETHNVYWLALDASASEPPLRFGARDVAPTRPAAVPVTQYDARLHFEADREYQPEVYELGLPWDQWAWKSLTNNSPRTDFDTGVSGAVAGETGNVRARFFAPRALFSFPQTHHLSVWWNDQPMAPLVWGDHVHSDFDTTTAMVDGTNRLSFKLDDPILPPGAPPGYPYDYVTFHFWELRFPRRFQAVADTLEFRSAATPGAKAYDLAPFADAKPGDFFLLDVSDPLRPVELTGWAVGDTTGGKVVHFHDDADDAFYFAATGAARLTPELERADVRDLRHGGADYLVICSDALEGEALRLAAHRSAIAPPFPGATSAVVRMSDILAWYGGGRMDPVAIRDFFYDAVVRGNWSPAPSYVCLLGDATFDFKDVFHVGEPGLCRTQVPTFGHLREALQYHSDDWLVDLDPAPEYERPAGGVPDLMVGRLPAENAAVASTLVSKMIAYDVAPERGPWRSRLLSLVDDLDQGTQPDPIGTGHIFQADSLERGHLPEWMDRRKVELVEYPFTQGTAKDGARQDLLRELDEGAVFWHYIGHGNPFKLADESAFLRDDVAALHNGGRQPFFFAAASKVGPFDEPVFTSLAEALVERADGGTIASYAGTITTFSHSNFQLGGWLYDLMLRPPELGGARTIGEASFIAKHRAYAPENDRKYHILGDPSTRLAVPRDDVRMTIVDDANGVSLGDSLPRGRRVRIEGEIHGTRDRNASDPRADRSGSVRIVLDDAPERRTVSRLGSGTASYDANPRRWYALDLPVAAGRFTARFVVPLGAAAGPGARVFAYFDGTSADGSGAVVSRLVDGTDDGTDRSGPTFDVRLASGGAVAGVNEEAILAIEDPSGVFTLPDTTLDGIAVSFDGGDPTLLTDRFRYDEGSSTRGTLRIDLPALGEGTHTLTVTASDNLTTDSTRAEHRSEHTVEWREAPRVAASAEVRAWVLPNPFRATSGVDVVFGGLAGASETRVRVFDVRGRLVRTLEGRSEGGLAQVRWDGRDAAGRSVAAGVYLYRAAVTTTGGEEHAFDGRLVLLP